MADDIGKLDQRITFQAATETDDGGGGKDVTWADFASVPTVWADAHPASGRESVQDGAFNASGTWVFHIRNRSDVSERDRIMWNGEPYNIRRVSRRGGRELYLTIEAERGVAQ